MLIFGEIVGASDMGLFDNIKKKFKKEEPKKTTTKKKSLADQATERGEPYVNIVRMDVNPENISDGAFELEWNDLFVARLIKAGYQGKPDDTDSDIVDRWFQNICRNVVMETWEQEQAMNPGMKTSKRDLGGGKSEIS
jgi:hypothetical protein